MRKIILYIAASLDGYIARQNGSIDWLENEIFAIENEDYGYSKFLKTIDTTLMGNSTYKTILGFGITFPYADKTNYVFSHSPHPDTEHVHFVHKGAVDFIAQLKQQPGKNIWLIGGGQLNTHFLNAGLIDEIILTYIPVILGSGIPLFATGAQERILKVTESKQYPNGFVQVRINV